MYNISKLIIDTVRLRGDHIAFSANGEDLTYNDLFLMARSTSLHLQDHKSSNIGIYCHSSKSFIIALYSCLLSGVPVFLINGGMINKDIVDLCDEFNMSSLLTDDTGQLKNINKIKIVSKSAFSEDLNFKYEDVNEEDVAFYLMTSGTTGKKRAVPVTHRNLLLTGESFNQFMGVTNHQREMVLVPLTHSFGVRRIVAQLLLGGSVFSLDGAFNPASALISIKKNHCTVLSMVPSQARMFLCYFRDDFKIIGTQIKFVELSSEYMAANEKEELMKYMPNSQIVMGYGLTEATRSVLLHFQNNSNKLDVSGKPLTGVEILILDDNNNTVSQGEKGQIFIKGDNVASAYYGKGVKENINFNNGGFFTGDIGFIDSDGFLTVVGRMDDIVQVGGKKFNPNEIEASLRKKFPDVHCAITHVPDEVMGSRIILCIQGEIDISQELLKHIGENFESFQQPRKVIFLDKIPITINGKIMRKALHSEVLNKI